MRKHQRHTRPYVRSSLTASELVLIALLLAWSVIPLVHLALELHGGSFSGADGSFPADQLQYLAWVRDSGQHLLAGNQFDIPTGAHVFVHPMWLLSGLLWRAGLPIALTVLIWKPIVVVALILGIGAYVARMLPGSAWKRTAVVVLAICYVSPLVHFATTGLERGISLLSDEMFTAADLWGYLPAALGVGLMPVYLLALERSVRADGDRQHRLWLPLVATGILLAWVHPWQGETVALITLGLLAWRRGRGAKSLLVGLAAVALPLAGYFALSHLDQSWRVSSRLAEAGEKLFSFSLLDLVAALGPLAAIAAVGFRRVGQDLQEQALVLWPLATLLPFVFGPVGTSHSLEGIAIPLAVMAGRGVERLVRLGQAPNVRWRPPAGAVLGATVLVLTLPGAIHFARLRLRLIGAGRDGQIVDPSVRSALHYLAAQRGNGGVLAIHKLGQLVPAFAGKPTWVGHVTWTPNFRRRSRFANALATGTISVSKAREGVARSKARYVLLGCGSPSLTGLLGPMLASTHQFGCATVYTLR